MWRPVLAGIWKQKECWDGTYTFDDLMDAHEMLDVKETNERLFNEYIEIMNGAK